MTPAQTLPQTTGQEVFKVFTTMCSEKRLASVFPSSKSARSNTHSGNPCLAHGCAAKHEAEGMASWQKGNGPFSMNRTPSKTNSNLRSNIDKYFICKNFADTIENTASSQNVKITVFSKDIHWYISTYIYIYIYIYLHISTYIYVYLHIPTYVYMYIHMYIHTHIYIYHISIFAHMRRSLNWLLVCGYPVIMHLSSHQNILVLQAAKCTRPMCFWNPTTVIVVALLLINKQPSKKIEKHHQPKNYSSIDRIDPVEIEKL